LDVAFQFIDQFVLLAHQMGIYLLIGFIAAGLLHVFVPERWVFRQFGDNSVGSVVKGALLGTPLPLCSCGVIPVAASLKKSGASPAATLSFLIATPVTGFDSILATYALMGTFLAVVRPLASITVALVAGLVLLLVTRSAPAGDSPEQAGVTGGSRTLPSRLADAVRYGLGELLAGIARPVLLGLAVGAAISVLVPTSFISNYVGQGFLSYAVMVMIATPLYVCATGSIPIAAALLAKGLSPGAALAFLLAGPATNTVTIAVAKDLIGKRGVAVYLGVIVAGSVALAWGTDALTVVLGVDVHAAVAAHHHEAGPGIFSVIVGYFILALVLWHAGAPLAAPLLGRLARRAEPENGEARAVTLSVPDATCQNCARTITRALTDLPSVRKVDVDLSRKLVVVALESDAAQPDLVGALAGAGHEATVLSQGE